MTDIVHVAFALVIGFALWFMYYGCECFINGDTSIWRSFWKELLWFLPGGDARKGAYIRKMVEHGNGVICSENGSWEYEAVRKGELYVPCGRDVLPGRLHFVITHVCIPLGPLVLTHFIHKIFV